MRPVLGNRRDGARPSYEAIPPMAGPVACVLLALVFCFCRPVLAAGPILYRQNSITSGLDAPTAVAVDEHGDVYVAEASRNRLRVYDHLGNFVRELKGLDKPTGVAVGKQGRIYVCNKGSRTIDVYHRNLSLMFRIGPADGSLQNPTAIALDSRENVFVVDSSDHKVKVYDNRGHFRYSFGGEGNEDGRFKYPVSIAIDDAGGKIVVADLQETTESARGARIQVFSMAGNFQRRFGQFGMEAGRFISPMGVAVDGEGRIYVADSYQNVVHVFDPDGAFAGAVSDSGNPLRTPVGIACNRKWNLLFVASLNTSKVEIFSAIVPGP